MIINRCCNNKTESSAGCTNNTVNENKRYDNEPKIANQNDKCCTNNSKSIDSIHNISNNVNNNFSEKDDSVTLHF